jgi:hypothetical protein
MRSVNRLTTTCEKKLDELRQCVYSQVSALSGFICHLSETLSRFSNLCFAKTPSALRITTRWRAPASVVSED